MPQLGKTKVWGRSYTTIPVSVRRILEININDEIEWFLKDGYVIIRKIEKKAQND